MCLKDDFYHITKLVVEVLLELEVTRNRLTYFVKKKWELSLFELKRS